AGLPGAFLAVPVAGALQVILAHALRVEDPSQAEEHRGPVDRAGDEGKTPPPPPPQPHDLVAASPGQNFCSEMDDRTPEMEQLTKDMRAAMAAWVAEPSNASLKQHYRDLQRRYQRLFLEEKQSQRNGVGG